VLLSVTVRPSALTTNRSEIVPVVVDVLVFVAVAVRVCVVVPVVVDVLVFVAVAVRVCVVVPIWAFVFGVSGSGLGGRTPSGQQLLSLAQW
jgi:hypothetical protein